MNKRELLKHLIAVYRRENHSGKYSQLVHFHDRVADDAQAVLDGTLKTYSVSHCIDEIKSEMVVLCMSPISGKRVSITEARRQAKSSMEAE